VITDEVKRKVYDKYGFEGIQNPDLYVAATSRFGNMFTRCIPVILDKSHYLISLQYSIVDPSFF
jgi:hypothetical protein